MTRHQQVKSKVNVALWLGVVFAASVSTVTLIFAAGSDRLLLGLATSPFGWIRVIVIHSVSSLMLSWWLARSLAKSDWLSKTMWPFVIWCLICLAVAGLTLVHGTIVQHAIDAAPLGYASRMLIRVAWCIVLQLPCWMIGISVAKRFPLQQAPVFSDVNLFALALITAIGVPFSFLSVFVEQQTNSAKLHWQQTQVIKAMRSVQRLCDLGSTRRLGERPASEPGGKPIEVTPQMALVDLQNSIQFIERQIEELTAKKNSDQVCLELAQWYVALDRYSDAIAVLRPFAVDQASVAIALAQVLNKQGQREESHRWATRALQMVQQNDSNELLKGNTAIIEIRAYDLLVTLAGEQADFQTAERLLRQALNRLPEHQAYFHSRLAKHYEFVGQLSKARQHQQKAADVDPENYLAPEGLWEKMLSTGAPVGLARPQSSRYK